MTEQELRDLEETIEAGERAKKALKDEIALYLFCRQEIDPDWGVDPDYPERRAMLNHFYIEWDEEPVEVKLLLEVPVAACGCCGQDYMNVTFPVRHLWEEGWEDEVREEAKERMRHRASRIAQEEAQRKADAEAWERAKLAELKAKYGE
jgi:hypothetical protein